MRRREMLSLRKDDRVRRQRCLHSLVRRILAGVLALAVTLTSPLAEWRTAAQSPSCGITQITDTTGGNNAEPSINADGTRIAFVSSRDLTGDNADGNLEDFLYDTQTGNFTQITNATGNFGGGVPSINAHGTRITFNSDGDLTGDNADGNFEIFLYDTLTSSFTQITDTTGGSNFNRPSISADGTRIAFQSIENEIILYDTQTSSSMQITDTTGGVSGGPSINADGTRIAFVSNSDLSGVNADGNFEIFLYDTETSNFTQITNTTGNLRSGNPSINHDGTRITFDSEGDLAGDNADGNFEVFLYDAQTNSLRQVTNTIGGENGDSWINADGTRFAFTSNSDLADGGNFEIFLYDTQTSTFTQLTDTTEGFNIHSSINADGTRIAFESDRDLTGGNADGNREIFLATCVHDSDDDGIPDDSDPDTVADVIVVVPNAHFNGPGNQNAFLNRLDAVEQLILADKVDQALQELQNLRRHVDGCGTAADTNDWIVDCASQLQVRASIDILITNLSS